MEYTNPAGAYDVKEEGEDMNMDPNAMGGMDPSMGGDPNAMGGMDAGAMGGDPNAMGGMDPSMGGDPNATGGDPNAMGGDPNAMGGPEGFSPQGVDPNAGLDGMGGDPNATGGDPNAMGGDPNAQGESEDEVVEIDDLIKSQEAAEKKIDKMSDKFEKLMGAVDALIKMNAERDKKEQEYQDRLRVEIDKRIPTPQQKLSMRSTKSAPYSMTPNEYMNNYAPDNYSDEDDNNGANDAQYKITKDDIDRFTDYNSAIRDLDVEHQSLKDILGY